VTALELVEDVQPATLAIGAPAPDFAGLLGVDGRRYGLSSFADKPLLVLIFASNRCPTVKAYERRLHALADDYRARDIQLVAINSNDPHLYPDESYERMIEFARDSDWSFPYLFDEGQVVARAYGPQRTFHVFVLDAERRLRYEGRFDDARVEERATSHELRAALDDLMGGRPVANPSTRAFGCSLDFV
jgi:peroxiredoxin